MVGVFIRSAGVVFLGMALAMMLANVCAPGLTRPRDPVLEISMSTLFWGVASVELALVWVCLFSKDPWRQIAGILWLSVTLLIYWCGLKSEGKASHFSLYLTSLADAFAVSPDLAFTAMKAACVYLLIGSGACSVWLWREQRASRDYLRTACHHCGGHIAFPAENLGRTLPCPHCQKTITLRKPGNLKISCFFCRGHIEFPAHAIGEKLKCPHCRMDITLKETA